MKNINKITALLLCGQMCGYAVAEVPRLPKKTSDTVNVRDNLQAIKEIEDNLREVAAETLKYTPKKDEAKAQKAAPQTEVEFCLNYKSVLIEGITLIDDKPFKAKAQSAVCISEDLLNSLSRDIVGAYISQGYVYTNLDFAEKDDDPSVVKVIVQEGKIREITGSSRKVNSNMLFPNHKGKPLNVYYLEQGLEQANKLTGNNVTLDVYPHDDGTATVALKNEESKSWFGSVSLDNLGNKPNQMVSRLQFGVDSPLGLSDSLYLSGYSNVRQGNGHYGRGGSLFYSVPYGDWTLSSYLGTSRSQSFTRFASGLKLKYRSESVMAGLKADKIVSRGSDYFSSLYAGVDYVNVTSKFAGARIAMQSPKLATVQAGVSHSKMLEKGVWINDLNVEVGTNMLGAKDSPNSPFSTRYVRYAFQSDFSQNHAWGEWLIRNKHRLNAQYSSKDLYAIKQFSLSDRSAVRGFKSLSPNGNSGVVLNNTLYARRYLTNGMYIEPYVGLDWGFAKDIDDRYIGYGGAAGINIGYKSTLQTSVEAARSFLHTQGGKKSRDSQVTLSGKVLF